LESISDQLRTMVNNDKEFNSSKLFKCILGLNEIESKVFSYLLKHNKASTMELTDLLEKDRSSIQRALQELLGRNVIIRESVSLKEFTELKGMEDSNKRGYLYVYRAKNLEEIKNQFSELLDKWYKSMKLYIKNLESTFDCFEKDGELC